MPPLPFVIVFAILVFVLLNYASEPETSKSKFEPNLIFKLLFWTFIGLVLAIAIGTAVSAG
jgi:hypothetical protein